MNVNFNNVGFYNYNSANSQKPSFKSIQQFKTDIKMPDANEYLQKYNNSNFDEKKAIQDEYKQKIIDVCFDENGKLNPQIKYYLKNLLFVDLICHFHQNKHQLFFVYIHLELLFFHQN